MKRRTLAAIVRIAGKRDELLVVDKGYPVGNDVAVNVGIVRLARKGLAIAVERESVLLLVVVLFNGVIGILLGNTNRVAQFGIKLCERRGDFRFYFGLQVIGVILTVDLEDVGFVEQRTLVRIIPFIVVALLLHHRLALVVSIPIGPIGNGTGDLRGVVIAGILFRPADPGTPGPSTNRRSI